MFPLTGNPEMDKALAEEHQRELLEDVEADAIAKGEAKEGDYEPVGEEPDELVEIPKRNKHIKHDDR